MNAAEQIAPTITEPLTWAEICERYPDEWVCVVDIDYDHPRVFEFRTARVVGHSKTKREAFAQTRPWWHHYKAHRPLLHGPLCHAAPPSPLHHPR